VWCAVLFAGRVAVLPPVQRLSYLLPSTASDERKLQEAQRVADDFGSKAEETKHGNKKVLPDGIRPRVLKTIKQKRLAAREELKAVLHTISLAGMELQKPDHVLRPADSSSGEVRLFRGNQPFLWSPSTGNGHWDMVLESQQNRLRLVLSPDEGGPLWAAFTWMANQGYKINFIRDEL
ncbi:unnamed protein product, partial [Symbiodinium necroappetens]